MKVWTDGACSQGAAHVNHRVGGWAWVAEDGQQDYGQVLDTTSNRMEMNAVLQAVTTLDHRPLVVHSDSAYVVNCFRDKWYEGWIQRHWRSSSGQPVKNRDLWEQLLEAVDQEVHFVKVRGHTGDTMNELADGLAVHARLRPDEKVRWMWHVNKQCWLVDHDRS